MFEILTNNNGTFVDIRLTSSRLSSLWEALKEGGPYNSPIALFGPNRNDEVRSLLSQPVAVQPVIFTDGPEFEGLGVRLGREALVSRYINEEFRRYGGDVRAITRIFLAHEENRKFEKFDTLEFISIFRAGMQEYEQKYKASLKIKEYINRVDAVCSERPIIVNPDPLRGMDAILALAIWMNRPRPYPSIVLTPLPFQDDELQLKQIESQSIELAMILDSIERIFGLEREDVGNAYRIGTLSRRRIFRAPNISRENITVPAARELCEIVSETFQQKIMQRARPTQRPAPIRFEYRQGGIAVSRGHSAVDDEIIIRAAALSLKTFCEGVSENVGLHNQIANFSKEMSRVVEILTKIISGDYDDGHVVSLGLEFNALQWQIDGVKKNLSETTMAEAAGLFANTELLLKRFPIWRAFSSNGNSPSAQDDFVVARNLLRAAGEANIFVDSDDTRRIGAVLSPAVSRDSPPPLVEGVVGSGENLSAAVVSGLSEVYVRRERGEVAQSADAKERDDTLVKFAVGYGDQISELARLKDKPWAEWGAELIKEVKSSFKL